MDKERLYELIDILNDASDCYYNKDYEKLSNAEYDKLYDELLDLENKLGIVRADSPSINIGYTVSKKLEKYTFDAPMLSLDKTKEISELVDFLKGQIGLLSYKMDGLTVVMTFEDGELKSAVTRGNGKVGEIITENAKCFKRLPTRIPYKKRLVVRGEAVISYDDFEKTNNSEAIGIDKYKNPRNLCSSTVRALDSSVVSGRGVHFFVFNIVEGLEELNSYKDKLECISSYGFEIVDYRLVDENTVVAAEKELSKATDIYPYPVDGLVLLYDDIAFGKSLGTTAKFPRNAIAFKWKDEAEETILRDVFWNASRTGRVNPIAIFDSVEIEGSTVSRASVHNLSTVKALRLGIGDRIRVYKANMIIPQILESLDKTANIVIPTHCPVCGSELKVEENVDVQVLYCPNERCPAKQIKSFELFVSRDAFNIEGLSIARLELLISNGFISKTSDIFKISEHKDKIADIDGMGEKSVANLLNAIEASRAIELSAFIYSLGIKGVGVANATVLAEHYRSIDALMSTDKEELITIENIGDIMADDIVSYFSDENNINMISSLLKEIRIKELTGIQENVNISGKTFVITGSLNHFSNREELKKQIQANGGKTAGSVSKKTDYLITNEDNGSTKSKKAAELGVRIITENEVIEMLK